MAMTIPRTSLTVTTSTTEILTGIGRVLSMRKNSTLTLTGLMKRPMQRTRGSLDELQDILWPLAVMAAHMVSDLAPLPSIK